MPDVTNLDASAVDICLGEDGTVMVTGLADGTYTITYDLAAPNAAVGLTGMVTSSGGTGELTILAANLTNTTATQTVTITSVEDANGCAPASVLTTTVDFEINALPDVTNLDASAVDICLGEDGTVTVTGLADGTYTITYDLAAPNAAVGLTGMVTSSGGTGELTIPAANLTNITATQTVTITSAEDANGCAPASVLATTADFEINDLPDVLSLAASAGDVCPTTDDAEVTISGLVDGVYTITYDLAAPNAATGLTGMVTVSSGTGILSIPGASLSNLTATQMVTITGVQDGNGCQSAAVANTSATFALACDIYFAGKVFLSGPYVDFVGLMHDSLRQKGLIPLNQPYNALTDFNYSGTETVNPSVLAVTGVNAIVDWVLVELRDETNPTIVLHRRAGLVQRDGDIVDLDGTSPIAFYGAPQGDYHVAVRHRNHLGVMTSTAITFGPSIVPIDFTLNTTANYQLSGSNGSAHAQRTRFDGKRALWAGNLSNMTNTGNRIIYRGNNADPEAAYFTVLLDPLNTSFITTHIAVFYHRCDANMDGRVIYQGANSDDDVVFFSVLLYPDNATFLANYVLFQQIPN